MYLGIMQPYLFPYIGYFQLVNAVDKFVIYDDVAYIKQGWINRNRILLNGRDFMFTVHLKDASSFRQIRDTEINMNLYSSWKNKFLKSLELAYKKAPEYYSVIELVSGVLDSGKSTIGDLATESIKKVCDYLSVSTHFVVSSSLYGNANLNGAERLVDICNRECASNYINPAGGVSLYNKQYFSRLGIELSFLNSDPIRYKQHTHEFIPWLSIIDVLMFNSKEDVQVMLDQYSLS